jgi:hypothetical protein
MADRNNDGTFATGNTIKGGRKPKEYSVTALVRARGEVVVDPVTGQTRADRLAEQLWSMAEAGDKQAVQYIIDRLDGKPKERIEQDGETVVRIVFDDGTDETTASPGEILEQPGKV